MMEISPESKRLDSLTVNGALLLWSEFQVSVEIPVGCFPKELSAMVLNYFLNNKDISQEEYEYLLSIVNEEELTLEQQQLLKVVEQNYKIALDSDKDSDWEKLKDTVFQYHELSLKEYFLIASLHKRDFSILAYNIACGIEKFAPKRIKYALQLLDIMMDTLDRHESDRITLCLSRALKVW